MTSPPLTDPTNLPQTVTFENISIDLPPLILVDDTSNLDTVRKADIALYNMTLKVLYGAWSSVTTMNQVFTLMDKTMMMIKTRRDILGLEYGSPKNQSASPNVWPHIP